MMKPDDFQNTIDALRQREPFRPFVIELDSGERVIVRDPSELSSCFGSADYEGPNDEMEMIDCWDVRQIVELPPSEVPAS